MTLSAPQNVLAVHMGGGAVLMQWNLPVSGTPTHYEVTSSLSLAGTYKLCTNGIFTVERGVIHNVPFGIDAYFQVRARIIDRNDSDNNEESSYSQAYLGILTKPTISMLVTAVSGSIIPQGAAFGVNHDSKRMIAFSSDTEVYIG